MRYWLAALFLIWSMASGYADTLPKEILGTWCSGDVEEPTIYRQENCSVASFTISNNSYETSAYKCDVIKSKVLENSRRFVIQVDSNCKDKKYPIRWKEVIVFWEMHQALGVKFITPKSCSKEKWAAIECAYIDKTD